MSTIALPATRGLGRSPANSVTAGVRLRVIDGSGWPSDPVELVALLYPRLVSLARVLTSGEDPEDLVQDTLVEMLARYPGFRGITYPLGYARIVMFRMAGASRRRARRTVTVGLQELLDSGAAFDERVVEEVDLAEAMALLGRKQRAALVLKFSYKLSTREVAAVLGSSQTTVRTQVMRATRRLKAALEPLSANDNEQRHRQ